VTTEVVPLKLAELDPAGIVTETGMLTTELLELRVTVTPLGPALPLRLTKPVKLFPPATVVGVRVRLESVAGETVNAAD